MANLVSHFPLFTTFPPLTAHTHTLGDYEAKPDIMLFGQVSSYFFSQRMKRQFLSPRAPSVGALEASPSLLQVLDFGQCRALLRELSQTRPPEQPTYS